MLARSADSVIRGTLGSQEAEVAVDIIRAHNCVLTVQVRSGQRPQRGREFQRLTLLHNGTTLQLGRCRYEPHPLEQGQPDAQPRGDPGDGRVIPLDRVFDFNGLLRSGCVVSLEDKIDQLPLFWRRKGQIRPAFRDYTAALLYDLQVYRAVFDEIDRSIAHESPQTSAAIRETAMAAEYPKFRRFMHHKVLQMELLVAGFTKQQHEQHGFYFRKQVWDIILCSGFLSRTNLKPRGYSGDSQIMTMLYDQDSRGATIFARLMHRYPLETEAAQAVRNRRQMVAAWLEKAALPHRPVRVMSVACGPSRELHDVLTDAERAQHYHFTLLDQDPAALAETQRGLDRLGRAIGATVRARTVRESVRTMLRSNDLPPRLGTFDLIYSMGLFDYLTRPVATAVLTRLYALLQPGGELMVGNFHHSNPTRVYMEYWADWVLYYRDEKSMRELAEGLPGAETTVCFDGTRCQMLLSVRKAPSSAAPGGGN